VILILNHGQELVYAFFGAMLAGTIPAIMPFLTEKLDAEHYRLSLSALFEVTRPSATITQSEFLPDIHHARESSRDPRHILVAENISSASASELEAVHNMPGMQSDPGDIALLQHSSGTTGLQKGVALSHRAVIHQLNSYTQAIQLVDSDVIVSWLPLYHDMGLIAGFLLPILCRIPLVLMSPFDWVRAPHKLLRAISNHRGTLAWLPNFAYNFCAQKVRQHDMENVDLSSWRAAINCSEPMHWKSHQIFLDRFAPYGFRPEALATSYAMAENVFAVTQGGITAPVQVDLVDQQAMISRQIAEPATGRSTILKLLSAGRPIEGTRVRVVNADGMAVPDRMIGEIAIQSDCMLTGYFNRTDLNASTFQDGWYLTGDLGYLANGELFIAGRKKDLIIVGGKNIYPQDLERLAGEVPGVHPGRIVAFGVDNESTGTEDVVVVAEVDEDDSIDSQKIGDEIRQRVTRGSDIVLRYVKIAKRGWLIKTSSGKIARLANRQKYLQELGLSPTTSSPDTWR
jgi:acyl-CoA synthetase (AMP-forming)/AMP-acid ligase II